MRCPILAAPLIAALSLAACSGQESAENEIQVVDPGTPVEEDGATFNISNEAVTDVPPPPSLPNENSVGPGNEAAGVIPARFRGEWTEEPSACGSGDSETRLRIGADALRFYESIAKVREIEVVSDRVIEVTADYSGEGQTWSNQSRLSLSPDGDTLTVTGEGATMTRTRCP